MRRVDVEDSATTGLRGAQILMTHRVSWQKLLVKFILPQFRVAKF